MPGVKFRNFGKFLGVYMIILMLAAVGVFTLTSCNNWPSSNPDNYDTADSVTVAQQIEAAINPQFTTVQDFVQFRDQVIADLKIDSAFLAMPEQILTNVASVVIKTHGVVTKKAVVEEYRANSAVYDNLPKSTASSNDTANEVDRTATDLGDRRESDVISTSYSYRTDTVDGKPVKVQIKKEESYVRQ